MNDIEVYCKNCKKLCKLVKFTTFEYFYCPDCKIETDPSEQKEEDSDKKGEYFPWFIGGCR